jgi:hypothetical protein
MINNIKTIVYHQTLCLSVPFIVLINISVENFKRKIPPTFLNHIIIVITSNNRIYLILISVII